MKRLMSTVYCQENCIFCFKVYFTGKWLHLMENRTGKVWHRPSAQWEMHDTHILQYNIQQCNCTTLACLTIKNKLFP